MTLAFDMDADNNVVSVVTMKRRPTGVTAKVVFKGTGPIDDPKAACAELKLADFAVVEMDNQKRARAVLVALSNGSTAAVVVPPSLEKAAVKKAYIAEQGNAKVLVPWTKLTAMIDASWLGPYMTISEALQENTKPKPRTQAPSKLSVPAALPTVEVPASSPSKINKEKRKIMPAQKTPVHVSESESEDSSDPEEDNDEDDSGEDINTDEGEEVVEETDNETEVDTESDEEVVCSPAKRPRIFDVTAVCSDEMETRKITARFEVHGQEEMNRVFESFRKGGVV